MPVGAIPAGLGRHPPQQAWAADCRLRNRESVRRGDKPAEIGMPKLQEPTHTWPGAGQPDVIGQWGKMRLSATRLVGQDGTRSRSSSCRHFSKPYVLDLAPRLSLVDHLVERGLELFLLDFGIPDSWDRQLRFEDHLV
jgi:hypothetical protein